MEQVERSMEELAGAMHSLEMKQEAWMTRIESLLAARTTHGGRTGGGTSGNQSTLDHNGQSANSESGPLQQPRLELPIFDRTEARAWIARVEQYFLVQKTPEQQRTNLAMIAMTGAAMSWFQLLLKRIPDLGWAVMKEELLIRFGDANIVNIYESLASVKQSASLEEYIAMFEDRVTQIPDFSDV